MERTQTQTLSRALPQDEPRNAPALFLAVAGGRSVMLSRAEARVLGALAELPGGLITPEDLARRLWGAGGYLTPFEIGRTLDGLAGKLRGLPGAGALVRDAAGWRFLQPAA